MAEPNPTGTKPLADAVTALGDAMQKFAKSWVGEDKGEDPEWPITNEALEQLKWARKKYDSIIRWILGCFIAIGVLIFGSLPFVSLGNVDPWRTVIGLGIAALGLVLVIFAATRGLEPEDASLGEIDESLDQVKDLKKQPSILAPRRRALYRFKNIVDREKAGHLGPGMRSVRDLIVEIATIEAQILHLTGGGAQSDGARLQDRLAALEAREVPPLDHVESEAALREALSEDRLRMITWISAAVGTPEASVLWEPRPAVELPKDALSRKTELLLLRRRELLEQAAHDLSLQVRLGSPTPAGLDTPVLDESAAVRATAGEAPAVPADPRGGASGGEASTPAELNDLAAHNPAMVSAERDARLQAAKERLRIRGQYRDLLLAESGIGQLRGTFHQVRALLLGGAVLTLIGGTVYAYALANPRMSTLDTRVLVSVRAESAEALRAWQDCDVDVTDGVRTQPALLVSAANEGHPEQGDVVVMTLQPDCPGKLVTLAAGEGTIERYLPSADDGRTSSSTDEAEELNRIATVTLREDSSAWRAAAVCTRPSGADLIVRAIVRTVQEDDGDQDGPFTITVIDDACGSEAFPVEVADGDGTYAFTQ